jgi:hypothetical protein
MGEPIVPVVKPKREWVPLDRLIRDPGLQMRASLPDGLTDPGTVERYREAIEDGDEFPPLEVVSDGETYWLFDGFQRAAALGLAAKGSAECLIYHGSYHDALLRSISANARHGLTRTVNDCRRALTTLIDTPELLEKVLAQAKDQGGVHIALATTCSISKGLVYKVLEERNLRAVCGKLVKKKRLPEQDIEDHSASHPGSSTIIESEAQVEPSTPGSETPADDNLVKGDPPPSQESEALRDLERARNAVASVRSVCWKLLDGPLAAHLLRYAALHRAPFSYQDTPDSLLPNEVPTENSPDIAGWEPLGKIEAVLSDLAAAVSGGLDLGE